MPQVAPCWRARPFCSVASCNLRTFWGVLGRKLQSLMFATSGGFAQFDKLRENV